MLPISHIIIITKKVSADMHKMQREMGRKKKLNMLRIKHVQNKFHNVLYLVQNT